ncbi:unnamed protein product [Ectocarpus sp. CCAP 1310/34]|nr:unnamed protein product [Ectocarpus sp. CCAP 1310/34]
MKTQLRSTEEFAGKPESHHPRRNEEQSLPPRLENLLTETVSPARWWALELRRVWSLLFVGVVVILLTLATTGGRHTGFDAPADVGRDRASLSQTFSHGERRVTDVQEVRVNFASGNPSDSPDVASQPSTTVSNSSTAILPKTHVSDVFRLVFVAGLEGTGHHYVMWANASLFGDNMNLPRRYGHGKEIYEYYAPLKMGQNVKQFTMSSHNAVENMRRLAEWAANLSSPGALEFFSIPCSYPVNSGPLKVMQYMDLGMIAETAEGAGIDFRVLYLRRSAKEVVIANTVHRKFHLLMGDDEETVGQERLFLKYMRVLFTDIAVLHSFLGEIGPEFVVCHDWDRLGDKEQASTIASFISPNDEIASLVESSLVQTAKKSSRTDPLPFEDAYAVVLRLQRKLDAFEHLYCG